MQFGCNNNIHKKQIFWWTSVIGYDLKLVTIMFVDGGYFMYKVMITDSQWDKVFQQNQITLDDWSGGLGVFRVHMNQEKGYW